MIWVARLLVVLFGLFCLYVGIGTMMDPNTIMDDFNLISMDAQGNLTETGRSAVRADMGAFFICSGIAAFVGLIPGQRHWLFGAIALFGVAFLGRLFGVFLDSSTQAIFSAMMVEVVSVAVLVFAYVWLGRGKPEQTSYEAPVVPQRDEGVVTTADIKETK